jgi:resuscitation-promoting factor RpfA
LVGAGAAELRLVAAPFLAAADLAADLAVAPRPVPARRALFPFDPAAPPRLDPLAPRPLPPRPLAPVPVPPLRAPERLAEVRDPAPRPEPAAAPLRPPPDVPDVPERLDLLDPPDDEPDPLPDPLLAPRGGTLGRITSGDSSL